MIEYVRTLAARATGVFITTFVGAVSADTVLDVGVEDWGSALEVSGAAVWLLCYGQRSPRSVLGYSCLLYTSDAADE